MRPVGTVPILIPVRTGIIVLIRFDSEFMRRENFIKITNYENLKKSMICEEGQVS